ncbi:MAG: glutathione S-transferase family protein [Gammaproteobacteria bacterium]|jgi:glutathione S-transferase|nr:glutathione S-transferase family protein [Gammaproteobacteria bacterium]NDG43906.1 glutathione S-transferase family protein [Gammaproteobacteria bacterium]
MRYQLFYALGSASMGVRAMLEEIGADYELIPTTIDREKPRPAEQLALNPNGWVPVLKWGDQAMYECAAITIFLCDRHPEAELGPSPGESGRHVFLQTLVYFSSSIQNAFQLTYYPDRFVDQASDESSAVARGNRRLVETWNVIDGQIGSNPWLLGSSFSAADIYLFMLTTWLTPEKGHPVVDNFPNVKRIAEAVAQRPSIRRVYGESFPAAGG